MHIIIMCLFYLEFPGLFPLFQQNDSILHILKYKKKKTKTQLILPNIYHMHQVYAT